MILITGGAGYIGSHIVKQLLEEKKDIIVLDNFSTSSEDTIKNLQKIKKFKFIRLDLNEITKLEEVFHKNDIDTIIHLAAFSEVGESIDHPMKYYINNTVNTINLVHIALKYKVKKIIFSSTAAVYGEACLKTVDQKITEEFITKPINPYGQSKLMSEQVIIDEAKVNKDFKYIIFRYFNVSGADMYYDNGKLAPRIGELHDPETHLIPLVVKTSLKKQESIKVFGEDYKTPDGTCIRDYIHVDDLADAHIKAITYLDNHNSDIFNCGYGYGFSVKEIIQSVMRITKSEFKVEKCNRREGDPSILLADNSKIIDKMNWKPKYNDIDLIIKSAFEWEKTL